MLTLFSLKRFTRICLFLFIGTLLVAGLAPHESLGSEFGDFETDIIKEKSIDDFAEQEDALTTFMATIINIVTGLVVIIGLISIVIGGYLYMTSGGDTTRVSSAKSFIATALLGIVLALTAWIILNTISPQFTPQKDPPLQMPN